MGLSRGMVALWDLRRIIMKAFKCFAGILLEGNIHGMLVYIHILNIYPPYKEKGEFWDKFISSSIMDLQKLIIIGDLNYTIILDETWGCHRKFDFLVGKIKNAIIFNNFLDIDPHKISPTWDNGRSDFAYVEKRLDRFLVHGKLMDRFGDVRVDTISNFISNHGPINLQWREGAPYLGIPLKFNRTLLQDPNLNNMVQATWEFKQHERLPYE